MKRLGALLLLLIYLIATIQFGRWQLHRLEERKSWNAAVSSNLSAPVVPVEQVLTKAVGTDEDYEWRRVEIVGAFDQENQTLIRGRYNQGRYGYEIITPLVPERGPALLVDRGWIPAGASATTVPTIPPAPTGVVRVQGRIRLGDSQDRPGPSGSIIGLPTRAANRITPSTLIKDLPYPAYNAYAEMTSPQTRSPIQLQPPQLSQGPHLAYAVQWFFFAALGLFAPFIYRRIGRSV